ncbi:MAG: alpha/beta hydrolase [Saprospiraceae bacterium]
MRFFRRPDVQKFRLATRINLRTTQLTEVQVLDNFPSRFLQREVRVSIFLPPYYFEQSDTVYPVLLFNDGQDMEAVRMADILDELYEHQRITRVIVAAVHANFDRIHEYGTAHQPDYKHRGAKAGAYTQFILQELTPALRRRYRCTAKDWVYAGFSLGGLSAFDIAWHHPELFHKIGVFSGSFWWRSQAIREDDPDAHRILIDLLQNDVKRVGMKFWLQTGTLDEPDDRNNNGIIDSIDDTLDVIRALKKMGYHEGDDIKYVEVIGGEHNLPTWSRVLPDFLQWAFSRI